MFGRKINAADLQSRRKCGYLKGLIDPLEPRDAKKVSKNKILYLATGSQGEPMGAMNRIINGVHPDVNLETGDCVIFSSKIIPGMKKIISFTKSYSKK